MPTPMLIVKGRKGYLLMPFTGEIPPVDFTTMETFSELSSYSYGPSVQTALKDHFELTQPLGEKE